jgi:hypothetical protein
MLFSYFLNLFYNIIFIIKYIYNEYIFEKDANNKIGKYGVLCALVQLLKFDIKLLECNRQFQIKKNKGTKTDIDIIANYKNKLIYFEVKYISKNTNNNNYINISKQIHLHKEFINQQNINYVLFIKGNKLLESTENIIKLEHPDINIIYNTIEILPEPKYDKKILMLSQGTLGFIVSYHNTDFIFNKLWKKFSSYKMCIYNKYYEFFDKRMNDSNINIERDRWNKIKSNIILVYDEDFYLEENIFDTFYQIRKKNNNYIKYVWMNNFIYIATKGEIGEKSNNFMDIIIFYSLGIFGCGQDTMIKGRNIFIRFLILIKYYFYILYFIYFI